MARLSLRSRGDTYPRSFIAKWGLRWVAILRPLCVRLAGLPVSCEPIPVGSALNSIAFVVLPHPDAPELGVVGPRLLRFRQIIHLNAGRGRPTCRRDIYEVVGIV